MQDTEEIWKDVVGYEGLYQVSNRGRVKSLKYNRQKILKPALGGRGTKYYYAVLNNKTHSVHRLVARHFIPPVTGKNIVNHIDGDSTNNYFSNLEWCTYKENIIHSYWLGKRQTGNRHHKCKLSDDQVRSIRSDKLISTAALGRLYGVSQRHIHRIKKNESRKHTGNV